MKNLVIDLEVFSKHVDSEIERNEKDMKTVKPDSTSKYRIKGKIEALKELSFLLKNTKFFTELVKSIK